MMIMMIINTDFLFELALLFKENEPQPENGEEAEADEHQWAGEEDENRRVVLQEGTDDEGGGHGGDARGEGVHCADRIGQLEVLIDESVDAGNAGGVAQTEHGAARVQRPAVVLAEEENSDAEKEQGEVIGKDDLHAELQRDKGGHQGADGVGGTHHLETGLKIVNMMILTSFISKTK